MVGDKHITRLVVNELTAHDAYADKMQPTPHPRPPLGWEITPIFLVEQASQHGDQCSNDAVNKHDGCHDAPLVYPIEVYHFLINHIFNRTKLVFSFQ